MRPASALSAAAVAFATAACGTTVLVPTTQQLRPALDNGLTIASPGAGAAAVAPGAGAPIATAAAGGAGSTPNGGSAYGASARQPGGSTHVVRNAGGQRIVVGQGVTATTVKIGVPYVSDAGAADQATGSQGIDPGDTRAELQALWDDVDRHGGLAGRRAVLDFYEIPATTNDVEQAEQAACAHFTQDQHDFAVINAGTRSFRTCLEKGGVLHVASDLTVSSDADVTRLPHNLQPAGLTMQASARTLVQGLNAMGYFTNAKVGILTFDDPDFVSAVDHVVKPQMQAIGHPAADTYLVPSPNSVADYGKMSQACTDAVVRFRAEGITHVILFDLQGRLATYFPTAAEAQHTHFDYGVDSQSGLQVGLDSGNVPRDQAVGAMGVGWLPLFDVAHQYQPNNPLAKRCLDFFARVGYPAGNANAAIIQEFMCQDAWTMQKVMGALATTITRDSALAAAQRLGTGVPNVADYAARLDARHHDGAAQVRLYAYDAGCGCMKPHGGTAPKV